MLGPTLTLPFVVTALQRPNTPEFNVDSLVRRLGSVTKESEYQGTTSREQYGS